MLIRLRPPALQRPCDAPTTVRASGSAPGLCGYDLRPSSARATPRRPSGPPDLRLASSRLATDEVAARHTDVGGAAHAELDVEMDLAARRESEGRIAGPRVLEVQLVADGAARQDHAAGHDGVKQAVE